MVNIKELLELEIPDGLHRIEINENDLYECVNILEQHYGYRLKDGTKINNGVFNGIHYIGDKGLRIAIINGTRNLYDRQGGTKEISILGLKIVLVIGKALFFTENRVAKRKGGK